MTTSNSFGTRARLAVAGRSFEIFRLEALDKHGFAIGRLPYSLRILLENLLRLEDGRTVRREDIERLARWDPQKVPDDEIAFMPARVLNAISSSGTFCGSDRKSTRLNSSH